MLRVSARRVGEPAALKNDLLFWRSRDTGTQDWKVVLLRKESKKFGQFCEVKLVPRELSNGDGMAMGVTVLDGVVSEAGEGDEELDIERVGVIVELVAESVEGGLNVDVELFKSPLYCRRSITTLGNGGGSRRSEEICPLLSSRLNSEVS